MLNMSEIDLTAVDGERLIEQHKAYGRLPNGTVTPLRRQMDMVGAERITSEHPGLMDFLRYLTAENTRLYGTDTAATFNKGASTVVIALARYANAEELRAIVED